jgi:hypothetical protein
VGMDRLAPGGVPVIMKEGDVPIPCSGVAPERARRSVEARARRAPIGAREVAARRDRRDERRSPSVAGGTHAAALGTANATEKS